MGAMELEEPYTYYLLGDISWGIEIFSQRLVDLRLSWSGATKKTLWGIRGTM